jgi:DNA-binding NarL/FixJ family response regulator
VVKRTIPQIRIAFAGHRRLFRDLFRIAFERDKKIKLIAESDDVNLASKIAKNYKPDVFVLDLFPPDFDVLEILSEIIKAYPEAKVLFVGPDIKENELHSLIEAGAWGYISSQRSAADDLVHAIKVVQKGEFWIDRKMTASILKKSVLKKFQSGGNKINPKDILTKREKEVFSYIVKGFTNKEIASALYISDKTVKCHVYNIFRKLKFNRRGEAILFAINQGIFNLNGINL